MAKRKSGRRPKDGEAMGACLAAPGHSGFASSLASESRPYGEGPSRGGVSLYEHIAEIEARKAELAARGEDIGESGDA